MSASRFCRRFGSERGSTVRVVVRLRLLKANFELDDDDDDDDDDDPDPDVLSSIESDSGTTCFLAGLAAMCGASSGVFLIGLIPRATNRPPLDRFFLGVSSRLAILD